MNYPKISIVVPSFNQGQYLEETLLSIFSQEYPNLELLVVDGGSTDKSIEIIKKYEEKISWWISEKDNGQSNAINKGFSKATGEIVSWLCSDDLFTAGTLKKVSEYFYNQPPDVGLIHGGTTIFKGNKEIRNDWGYYNPSIERNLAGMAFSQPSAFFLKNYLDKVGGQLNEKLHFGMDYDLFCRLACVCRFLPVQDIFSKYRLHGNSKSVASQDKFIDDWNRVFSNLCQNAGWEEEMKFLSTSGIFEKDLLSFYYPYSFELDRKLLDQADKKKILYYHYCHTLKSYYKSGIILKSKKLSKLIRKTYKAEWWKNEKSIRQIMKRLLLPTIILKTLKKIRKII